MASGMLPQHEGLRATTRLGFLATTGENAQTWEWLVLIGAGMTAAVASTFLDFNLRIPGHAILQVVVPIAAGLAIVPRRNAGTFMGLTALITKLGLRLSGFGGDGLSLGAMTSLTATGPLLDWTLRRNQGGWLLYLNFALAGLMSNLLALFVRGAAKLTGFEHASGRPLAAWLAQASVTYVVCGLLAGLVSGMLWFYGTKRHQSAMPREAP
ncbi:MAG: hypothetical protein JWN70_6587 [Planctomycetaceae bacterium]|nr:hypothetical protein [Planctomycetaceae bacterium]